MTKAAILIEDLGLTLHRSGNGMFSSCVITEYQYLTSNDLKSHRSRLKIERIFEPQLKPVAVKPKPIIVPAQEPKADIKIESQIESSGPLHEVMKEVSQKLSQMVELLARQPSVTHIQGQSIESISRYTGPSPVSSEILAPYVPSTILPKDVVSRISVKEAQTDDDDDFQSSAEALRKMRKR